MKRKIFTRHWRTAFLSLFSGLLLILAFMAPPALADRSLSMDELVMDVQVLPDASLQVTERITVDFSGQWNGFYIKIPLGDTPIIDVIVSENGQPYEFNPGTEYGPAGTYLTKNEGGDILIDWSINAYNQVRTFDVSYRVINGVKIHNDVAELYRKFVGEANGNKIAYVEVNLMLPPGAEGYKQGEDIRIWGHGPLNGEVDFAGPDQIIWTTSNLSPYTFLEGRVVMPVELFAGVPAEAYSDKVALGGILAEEQSWADKANKERAQAKAQMGGGVLISGGSLAGIFMLWRRFGRKHPTSFDGDYYRELPADYSPAELSVLWNFNKMKAQDITATILDLARRQFLYLEAEAIQVKKLLGSKEVMTYRLSFMPAPAPESLRKPEEAVLKPHEKKLIDYLKNDIGGGKDFIYLTDIENYAKRYGEAFHDFWTEWTGDIIASGDKYKFFDDNGKLKIFTILGGIAAIILGFVSLEKAPYLGYGLIIAGFLFALIPLRFNRRSVSGQEDYARWEAFKRFLLHFSEMQRHEIPSLIIWEHYLVYAVTLGVAKEVIKQLEIVFPNMQEDDYRFGHGWIYYGAYGSGMNALNNSFDGIGNSFERAVSTAQKAASKASSGSGGGGGFSGGGGGGGGGGSYGGR